MTSNDELKVIDIENGAFNFFGYIIRVGDFDFDNILLLNHMKNHMKISVQNILHKTFMGAKPLRIRFDKLDGFI